LNIFMNESEQVYEQLARVAGALASPVRLRALHLLFQGPRSIEELASELGASVANTGAHMKALREAGLVTAERRGKYIIQATHGQEPLRLFLSLREAAESLLPAMQLLHRACDDDAPSEVSPETLAEATGRRRAMLADLRPAPEYRAGHLPGAVSIPFDELEARLGELPGRRRILVYCRGKYCPKARRGAELMRGRGLRVERLLFGVPEWLGSGRALEASS
jgi:DNA-binding transcriptional ArsR family regulator